MEPGLPSEARQFPASTLTLTSIRGENPFSFSLPTEGGSSDALMAQAARLEGPTYSLSEKP